MTVDNMFHDFAMRRRQGNKSIVGSLNCSCPFLKSGVKLALVQSSGLT